MLAQRSGIACDWTCSDCLAFMSQRPIHGRHAKHTAIPTPDITLMSDRERKLLKGGYAPAGRKAEPAWTGVFCPCQLSASRSCSAAQLASSRRAPKHPTFHCSRVEYEGVYRAVATRQLPSCLSGIQPTHADPVGQARSSPQVPAEPARTSTVSGMVPGEELHTSEGK